MKKNILATAIISTFLAVSAFAAPLVTVNGQGIEKSQVDNEVKNLAARSNGQIKDTPETREAIKNQLINQVLIQQEAKKRGLTNSTEFKAAMAKAEAQFSTEALFMDMAKKNPVSDADVRKVYNEERNALKGTQEVQIRQIVVGSQAEASKILAELAKGGNFAKIAEARSIEPSAKQTGGLVSGYANLKQFEEKMPNIYAAINNLKKGGYTKEAVQANNDYAIFKIEDKRNTEIPPFDSIKEQIRNSLQQQKIAQAVNELRQKASIK